VQPASSDRGPTTHLFVFAVPFKNIAVPVDFVIGGKLAQTVFPGRENLSHLKPKLSNALIREFVMRFLSFFVQPVLRPLVVDPMKPAVFSL
jgi:hypothetical protein